MLDEHRDDTVAGVRRGIHRGIERERLGGIRRVVTVDLRPAGAIGVERVHQHARTGVGPARPRRPHERAGLDVGAHLDLEELGIARGASPAIGGHMMENNIPLLCAPCPSYWPGTTKQNDY